MIENRNRNTNPLDRDLSFTRTAVALLLIGSLLLGMVGGAGATLLLNRLVERTEVIAANAGGSADLMEAVEQAEPITVAITMLGVKPDPQETARSPKRSALGTGFVMDLEGHILTTSDVAKADRLQIVFSDGRAAVATLVGEPDKVTKVAVLRISTTAAEPPVFGRVARLRPGESLISMGTSLRTLSRTVDVGSVAALGHTADLGGKQEVDSLIQTDAVAPEGSAGGPVLNSRGEVVGLMVAPSRQPGGWSLVLPVETAQGVARRIIAGGSTSQASLGIQPITITPEIAKLQGLTQTSGALVNAVFPNSPAAKKLKPRDIIISVDGKVLSEQRTLDSVLVAYRPGNKVNLQVVRNGLVRKVTILLVADPAPGATPSPSDTTP